MRILGSKTGFSMFIENFHREPKYLVDPFDLVLVIEEVRRFLVYSEEMMSNGFLLDAVNVNRGYGEDPWR